MPVPRRFNGYSTIWLASALPESGKVYTIDIYPRKVEAAAANFEKAGLSSKIVQMTGNVGELLSDLPADVDFIFLDADRKMYTELADPLLKLLKAGGLLVCDNATSHPHDFEALIAWLNNQDYLSTSLVPVGKGELLVFKEKQNV